jgi:molybdopterin converting factor subunit 1
MNVRVLFFASLRERVKRSETSWSLRDGASVGALWDELCRELPQIEAMSRSVTFAVNREYVDRDHVLAEGDEVAVIPPVSGGA